MGSGVGHPDLAVYRLVKGGDSGLNLSLSDVFDRKVTLPSAREIITSLIKGSKLQIVLHGFSYGLIRKLELIQSIVDEEIKAKIESAKRGVQ